MNLLSSQKKQLKTFWKYVVYMLKALLVCIFPIIICYLFNLLIVPPSGPEVINLSMLISAISLPVTLIITSKIPIIKFRIYSNYRYGFNSIISWLALLFMLGIIAKILPSINQTIFPSIILGFISKINFLNYDVQWFQHILEIEVLGGVAYFLFRIIWLSTNLIKFHKNTIERIYHESEVLIESKDENAISLLIIELRPIIKDILQLAISKVPNKGMWPVCPAQELLRKLLSDDISLEIIIKKHHVFLGVLVRALVNNNRKNPLEGYKNLQEMILITPLATACKMEGMRPISATLLAIDFSVKENKRLFLVSLKRSMPSCLYRLLISSPHSNEISPLNLGKYFSILAEILKPEISKDELRMLLEDFILLKNLLIDLNRKNGDEVRDLIMNCTINEDTVIILKRIYYAFLHKNDQKKFDEEETNWLALFITIVRNILFVLAKGSMLFTSIPLYERFCKKLFDTIVINDPAKKDLWVNRPLKDITDFFIYPSRIQHDLSSFDKMRETHQQFYYPLNLFFQIYSLKELKQILYNRGNDLRGSEIIAERVLRGIESALSSYHDDNELYLPSHIRYKQKNNKYSLIDMKNEDELELLFDYSN